MELIIVFAILALVIWWGIHRAWRRRQFRQQDEEDMLRQAWSIVLSDPKYHHRKRYEEQLLAERAKLQKEAAKLRKEEEELRNKEGL
jgi:hypothetical protein